MAHKVRLGICRIHQRQPLVLGNRCFEVGGRPLLNRALSALVWIMLSSALCLAQSSFQELTPGSSTRADVARVFGRPVRSISPTIVEYAPPQGIAKVEVEYRNGSEIVERIEVYFLKPLSRPALVQQFGLAQAADKKASADGALVEYFGGASLLALTYSSAEPSSGISHIGYYSRELFQKASGITSRASQPSNPVGGNRESCFADDPGMAGTRTDHENWAQRQSSARLEADLAEKIDRLFSCPSLNDDQLSSSFADLSVVIAHWAHNYTCFGDDVGASSEDWSGHKEWARSRNRNDLVSNLQWKIRAAFKCFSRVSAKVKPYAPSNPELFAKLCVAMVRGSP